MAQQNNTFQPYQFPMFNMHQMFIPSYYTPCVPNLEASSTEQSMGRLLRNDEKETISLAEKKRRKNCENAAKQRKKQKTFIVVSKQELDELDEQIRINDIKIAEAALKLSKYESVSDIGGVPKKETQVAAEPHLFDCAECETDSEQANSEYA